MTTTTTRRATKKKTSKKVAKKTSKKKVATKKKRVTKKRASKKKTSSKKQPKWTVVTYKQIEARRQELGLPKSAMAKLLGVTNSTYHNWRRGTTVPHEAQQQAILEAMHKGPSKVDPTASSVDKPAGAPKKVPASKTKSGPFGSADFLAGDSRPTRSASSKVNTDTITQDGTRCEPQGQRGQETTPQTAPMFPTEGALGQIVTAFIQAKGDKASAGEIVELVQGLRAHL